MRRIEFAVLLTVLLLARTAMAQTPPPTQQTPPPTQQTPPPTLQTPPPVQQPPPPVQTPPTLQTPAAPAPFPEGAKIGFVNFQRLVDQSALGKQGVQKLQALAEAKKGELAAHDKRVQALQQEIQSQASVLSPAVLAQKNAEMQKLQGEAQLMQQSAQTEYDLLQNQLLDEFEKMALPIIEKLRVERGLWFVLAIQEGGGLAVVAVDPGLNLTAEVAKRMDAPAGAGG
jgi:Skp family chaperone for outer membrane proteins